MNKKIIALMLIFPLLSVSLFIGKVNAEAPVLETPYVEEKPKTEWTVAEVKELVTYYQNKWGVTDMHRVVSCESSYNYKAVNWQDSHRLSKGSHGVAQYSKQTMLEYAKKMGKDYNDPYNPEQALDVMGYMFSKGLQYHWSCYKK